MFLRSLRTCMCESRRHYYTEPKSELPDSAARQKSRCPLQIRFSILAAILVLSAASATPSFAQGKKKPAAPAPPKPQAGHGVKGTAQQAGDNGKLGEVKMTIAQFYRVNGGYD